MKKKIKERKVKRFVDILFSLVILIILSPFFLTIAIFVKLAQFKNSSYRGPVFFKETRVSKGEKFTLYKFRTVKYKIYERIKNGERSITEFTASREKDKSLTPLGSFLAQMYLDELPQFFNVLKGDMSLVGPRPHIPEHYANDIKYGIVSAKYIKAGVMGLVQASKGNPAMKRVLARMAKKHITQNKTMIFVDRLYFQKYIKASAFEMFLYDLWIMYKCAIVVLEAKGM